MEDKTTKSRMKILTSKRLNLRPWVKNDKLSLVKYANNRKISINLRDRFPFPYTNESADNWLKIANEKTPLNNFAIEFNGEAIGGVGLILGEDIFRMSAEIGYWLGEPFWGKGLMSEAIKLVIPYAFKEFNLVRLWAGVFASNPASAKVLEKAGFQFECIQKKALVKEGQIFDQILYALMK